MHEDKSRHMISLVFCHGRSLAPIAGSRICLPTAGFPVQTGLPAYCAFTSDRAATRPAPNSAVLSLVITRTGISFSIPPKRPFAVNDFIKAVLLSLRIILGDSAAHIGAPGGKHFQS